MTERKKLHSGELYLPLDDAILQEQRIYLDRAKMTMRPASGGAFFA